MDYHNKNDELMKRTLEILEHTLDMQNLLREISVQNISNITGEHIRHINIHADVLITILETYEETLMESIDSTDTPKDAQDELNVVYSRVFELREELTGLCTYNLTRVTAALISAPDSGNSRKAFKGVLDGYVKTLQTVLQHVPMIIGCAPEVRDDMQGDALMWIEDLTYSKSLPTDDLYTGDEPGITKPYYGKKH